MVPDCKISNFWMRPSERAVLTLPCKCFGIHCSPKVDITRKSPRSFMSTAPPVSTFHLLDATCCHCIWWDLPTLYLHICITGSDQILVAERPGKMFCQTHVKMPCNYNYACLLVVRKIVPKVYSIRTLLWTIWVFMIAHWVQSQLINIAGTMFSL